MQCNAFKFSFLCYRQRKVTIEFQASMSYDKLDVLSFYLSKGHRVTVKMQIAVEILNQGIWGGLGVWNWSHLYVHSLYTEVQSDPKPQSQPMRFTVIPHNTMVKHLWFAVNYGNWKLHPEIYQPADLHQAASFCSGFSYVK